MPFQNFIIRTMFFIQLPAKQTDDNSMIASTSPMSATAMSQLNTSQQELELDEEVGLELPPPMKPIQEPHIIANGPPAFTKDTKDNPTALVRFFASHEHI